MTEQTKPSFLKSFFIWFAIFYSILLIWDKFFAKKETKPTTNQPSIIEIQPVKKSFVTGNLAQFKIINNSENLAKFSSPCENDAKSIQIFREINNQKIVISDFTNCSKDDLPEFEIQPKHSRVFALTNFNNELFSEMGNYGIELNFENDNETISATTNFEIKKAGTVRLLFRALISRPLFNILVFLTQILPYHSFGLAIIILTFLVRLILFIPNQKAMRSQREQQKMQEKVAEIREKYKHDQKVLAMKTMELYKTHGINPMSSCLPMLIQFPIMIGLYYIIRDGLSPHLHHLFYSFYTNIDLSNVNSIFLGLDLNGIPRLNLNQIGMIILPVVVGVAQWFALHLSNQ